MNIQPERNTVPADLLLPNGSTLSFHAPLVMGIVNVTPDSFYDGGKHYGTDAAVAHAEKLLEEGADIIDLGAYSTRPNAADVGEEEERKRLLPVLEKLLKHHPKTVISVDTWRSGVALEAGTTGASIINDISGGTMDDGMIETTARLNIPYVLMHIKGTPQTMQIAPEYSDITDEVECYFTEKMNALHKAGVKQIIIDPGFGFGKTNEHNYTLLHNLHRYTKFGMPLLAGLSRKSMIYKPLGIQPDKALAGTIALNTIALLQGAHLLRVHDVAEARQTIELVRRYKNAEINTETRV
jgi:dihydropteroate synthase